jgi:hypothetical protein
LKVSSFLFGLIRNSGRDGKVVWRWMASLV